jgi:uncharacterized membrane protein
MHFQLSRARRLGTALLATGAFALGACGGDDEPTTPAPTPTIAVALAPNALAVTQGQSAASALTLTRGGNYTGAVALTASGAPAGLTVTLTPTSLTGTTLTSAIAVAAGAQTAPGSYPITITGAGSGVSSATATLTVTVAAAPARTVAIAAAPTALTATAGGAAATTTVTITRGGGFADPVELTVEGTPANVTATLSPSSVSGTATTSTLTVTAGANATPGAATLTLRARGQGVADATTTVPLTIAPAAQVGTFTIALTPDTVRLAAGASATTRIGLARSGGFTGPVTIEHNGAPAGVTFGLPAALTGDTATLTVRADTTVAPGTYRMTISGVAQGITPRTAILTLVVAPRAQTGSYALSVAPAAVSVQQGGTGTATVNIARTNFTGAVALAATGAPAGITVTPNPASATGATSALSVSVGSGVAVGSYPVTITGTAAGLANQTATLTVQVTAPASGGSRATFNFCAPDLPIWVAFQRENGAWTRASAGANNSYSGEVGARGGVAYVTRTGTAYDLTVVYGTAAELTASSSAPCALLAQRGTKRLTGTVAGLGETDGAFVTLGPEFQLVFGQPSFTMDSVPDGPLNLVATRVSLDSEDDGITPNRIILRRNVNYANNSAIPTLDFNGSEAFAPASANLTIANLGSDSAVVGTSFYSGAFGAGAFSFSQGGATQRYAGVPADRLQGGELQTLFVQAASTTDTTTSRGIFQFIRGVSDRTVTIGPNLGAVSVSAASTTPYLRPRATFASQAQYGQGATVDFDQDDRTATVTVSAAYLNGAPTTWDISVPDLSAAGFDPTWGCAPERARRGRSPPTAAASSPSSA